MTKGWIVGATILVAILCLAAYIASPFLAARDFVEAAKSGDVDKLDASVDFPSLRETLKSQLNSKFTQSAMSDPEMKSNPFASLGIMLVPTIVDKIVDAYVTPDGIAGITRGRKISIDKTENPDLGVDNVKYSYEYISFDRFRVKVSSTGKPDTDAASLVWERRGLFTWKLIRFDLPQSIFDSKKEIAQTNAPLAPKFESSPPVDQPSQANTSPEIAATPDQVNGAKAGMTYSNVRSRIISAGFTPVPRADPSGCDPDEHIQCKLPETESCSQGQEFCNYLFRHADKDLRVLGRGEVGDDPTGQIVDAIMIHLSEQE